MATDTNRKSRPLFIIPLGLVLVDCAFQKIAQDPLNPIKLWVLGFLAAWAFADITSNKKFFSHFRVQSGTRIYAAFILIFILSFFVVFLLSTNKSFALLGLPGRNLGFLNYLFLCIIALYCVINISISNIRSLYWTVVGLLTILSTYGLLQHTHNDFLKWVNANNSLILFTGNPDFASSLLGLLAVICFSFLFLSAPWLTKVFLGCLTTVSILDIYFTKALQGIIVVALGIGLILCLVLWQKMRKAGVGLVLVGLLLGVASILGSISIGPLSKYLHKASVVDRGYDWQAALHMFTSHPFFGVGIERYQDYFLQYRSPKYPLIYGYQQSVNNAHNVFLELFATAGVFVGLSFICLLLFVAYRAYIALRYSDGEQQLLVGGIVAGWLAYVAQLFISVDIAAISLWGWVLGAAIVSLSSKANTTPPEISGGKSPKFATRGASRKKNNSLMRLSIFGVLSVGLACLVIPMNRNEAQTIKFGIITPTTQEASKNQYRSLANAIIKQPLLSSDYKVTIALAAARNNFFPEAITYLKDALRQNPRNASAYSLLAAIYDHQKQTQEAIVNREKLASLDPYGAENLLSLAYDYLITGDKKAAFENRDAILVMAPETEVARRATQLIKNGK